MVRWNGHSHFPYLHPIVCHYLVQNGMWTGEGNRVRKRADSSGYRLSSHSLHSFPFLTARAEVREVTLGQEWATCGPMNDQQVIGIKDEFLRNDPTLHLPPNRHDGRTRRRTICKSWKSFLFSSYHHLSISYVFFIHFHLLLSSTTEEKGRYGRWLVNYCPFTSLLSPLIPSLPSTAVIPCIQGLPSESTSLFIPVLSSLPQSLLLTSSLRLANIMPSFPFIFLLCHPFHRQWLGESEWVSEDRRDERMKVRWRHVSFPFIYLFIISSCLHSIISFSFPLSRY